MNNNSQQNGFSYTYCAKQQAEIKRIREKYMPKSPDEDKMARLIRLDKSVENTAQTVSLIFGLLGALIFGFGMSLCMTDLLTVNKTLSTVIGIICGLIGGTLAILAYPIYNKLLNAKKRKLAPEILLLTDELLK